MALNVLTTEQVAARLGVKRQTIYAYVSRGLLGRTLSDDGRTSLFDPREVEQLARRGRPRGSAPRSGRIEVAIATSVAGIVDERLYYRGHEATTLAGACTFEQVAELLWTGALPEEAHFALPRGALRAARRACAELPPGGPSAERFAVACAALACEHPLRVDLRPARVREHAKLLLHAFVGVLPQQPRRGRGGTAKGRRRGPERLAWALWSRLSSLPRSAARVGLLDATLVLLADHELATSTLAARVAASTRADPYGVVLAGLGAMSGPLHGKAALSVHRLLQAAVEAPTPRHAVAEVISPDVLPPGFGHPVYRTGDPRALRLLQLMRGVVGGDQLRVIAEVQEAAAGVSSESAAGGSGRSTPAVNVDFALGALAYAMEMPLGGTEAIFAIARTAGWIAHAMEEYDEA
jgi:citrate synthase